MLWRGGFLVCVNRVGFVFTGWSVFTGWGLYSSGGVCLRGGICVYGLGSVFTE